MRLQIHHNSKLQNTPKSCLEFGKEVTNHTFSNLTLKLLKQHFKNLNLPLITKGILKEFKFTNNYNKEMFLKNSKLPLITKKTSLEFLKNGWFEVLGFHYLITWYQVYLDLNCVAQPSYHTMCSFGQIPHSIRWVQYNSKQCYTNKMSCSVSLAIQQYFAINLFSMELKSTIYTRLHLQQM